MPQTADVDAAPALAEIGRARDRLRGVARNTPLIHSPWLSDVVGVPIHLKLECWQRTGSFKFRGAFNAVALLDEAAREGGIVTASAGNHGLALATAARLHGTRATIFAPQATPRTKKERIRRAGGELREVPGIYDDAAAAARSHAAETGAHFLNAFNDPDVVAGQGTVALEILDTLPEVGAVVVPVGGGGLIAGVGRVMKAAGPDPIRVLGVQSSATTAMRAAFDAGGVVDVDDPADTLCEGLAGETEHEAYVRARAVTDELRLVDEDGIAPAIRALYRHEGVVAEGSGAVGVAALLAGELTLASPTAVIISGGNIDGPTLARILED